MLRLVSFVAPYRTAVVAALLALLIAAGAVLAFGHVIREVVDEGFGNAGSFGDLDKTLMRYLGVVIVMALSIAVRSYLINWLGEHVVADLRKAVFDRVVALEPGRFETIRTGEIITRLTTDTSVLQVVIDSSVVVAIRNALLVVGGFVMLLITSPRLTLLVLIGVPLVVTPVVILGARVRRLAREGQDRIADVGAYVDEALYGIRTVQAFCHEPIDRRHYARRVAASLDAAIRRAKLGAVLVASVTLITFFSIGIVLWVGGRDVLGGAMSAGELSAFVFYAFLVASSTAALSGVFESLFRAAGAGERVLSLLDARPEISAPSHPVRLPIPVAGRLSIEDVSFAYPSRPETPALSDLSVRIEAGERVALVGPSGAGKSTLFELLVRFYDPQHGRIRFDGIDLRDLDPAELRGEIAIVPQEPVLFSATAAENIRFGRDYDDEAVRRAADAAHASEFIDRLAEGFDTFLGERGVRLSGGQRQRIAIARAVLGNPRLLLLDEATSSLDAASERLVQEALESVMAERTSIVIAHRLATVRKVDRILVLDGGRLVASGSHDQLVASDGLYARLADLQFGAPIAEEYLAASAG